MKQTKEFRKILIVYWLPIILYIVVMFTLAIIPITSKLSVLSFNSSMYVLHAFEFFVLGVLLFRLFNHLKLQYPYLFTLVLIVLFGLLTETAQLLVSYRSFNPFDVLADTIGGLFILLKKFI